MCLILKEIIDKITFDLPKNIQFYGLLFELMQQNLSKNNNNNNDWFEETTIELCQSKISFYHGFIKKNQKKIESLSHQEIQLSHQFLNLFSFIGYIYVRDIIKDYNIIKKWIQNEFDLFNPGFF